jgi:putative membrane protein
MMHQHEGGWGALLLVLAVAVGYEGLSLRTGGGRPWIAWRGASFMTGCALLVLALAPDQNNDFPTHVRQHLLIGMLAPTALVLGAPVTLLLRTLPPTAARRLGRVLRLRAVQLLAHPVSALGLTVGALAVLHLTRLYTRTTTDPVLHDLVHLHFLLSGYLFAWIIAGPDPAPLRPSVPLRLVVLGVAITAHAVLSQLIYAGVVDVGVSAVERRAGATLMYYGGDIAELLLAVALVTSWRPRRRTLRRRTCGGEDSRCRNEQTHSVYDENARASPPGRDAVPGQIPLEML